MKLEKYINDAKNNLGLPHTGGTDWRVINERVAEAFYEIVSIANPSTFLEIGFNCGGSALAFLIINPLLHYDSIDIVRNEKSEEFLKKEYINWRFFNLDSRNILPGKDGLKSRYDLILIDGDHSPEGVSSDIEKSILFNPEYLLFDDVKHPSHKHIEQKIKEDSRLEIIKLWEFNEIWDGYSMAICKVK